MTDRPFGFERHRRERLRELERRCEFLDAERVRLERLLAFVLRGAAATLGLDWRLLLDAGCELTGTNPAGAAMYDGSEPALEPQERAA